MGVGARVCKRTAKGNRSSLLSQLIAAGVNRRRHVVYGYDKRITRQPAVVIRDTNLGGELSVVGVDMSTSDLAGTGNPCLHRASVFPVNGSSVGIVYTGVGEGNRYQTHGVAFVYLPVRPCFNCRSDIFYGHRQAVRPDTPVVVRDGKSHGENAIIPIGVRGGQAVRMKG